MTESVGLRGGPSPTPASVRFSADSDILAVAASPSSPLIPTDQSQDVFRIKATDGAFFENFLNLVQQVALKRHASTNKVLRPASIDETRKHRATVRRTRRHRAVNKEVDALYRNVLYTIIHSRNLPQSVRTELLACSKRAFERVSYRHDDILQNLQSIPAPVWNLRVHVHCGRNLKPKQTGGSGDPLCDIVLLPLQKQRFRTRSCPKTLNPEWNQQVVFSDVNLEQDSLLILVSDHLSEASPLRDRIKQIEEVRSPSGLTRYFKNVAHAVKPSGGQSSEPFAVMGKLHISLQDIPAGRSRAWYALEGRSKQNPKDGGARKEAKLKAGKGDIDVTTELGTFASDNQDERLDIQSLKLLWVILVKFELSLFKGASDVWHGRLSRESELILRQYEAVTGYSPTEASVASWLALWEVYQEQPLDFAVINRCLDSLPHSGEANTLSPDQKEDFLDSLKDFWDYCLDCVGKHRFVADVHTASGSHFLTSLIHSFKSTHHLLRSWKRDIPNHSSAKAIAHALSKGNDHWYQQLVEATEGEVQRGLDLNCQRELRISIEVLHMLAADLQEGRIMYHALFLDEANVHYCDVTFKDFEKKIITEMKPQVLQWCEELDALADQSISRGVILHEEGEEVVEEDKKDPSFEMGTAVFELYLAIQSIIQEHHNSKCSLLAIGDELAEYHRWFEPAVHRWILIAQQKATMRIFKAVELDSWSRLDDIVFHSMSAVNTTSIFSCIVGFWKQLAWPDLEAAFVFICQVIKCICDSALVYVFAVRQHLEKNNYFQTRGSFEINPPLCSVLSSVKHVVDSLSSVPLWLETEALLDRVHQSEEQVHRALEEVAECVKSAHSDEEESKPKPKDRRKKMRVTPAYTKSLLGAMHQVMQNTFRINLPQVRIPDPECSSPGPPSDQPVSRSSSPLPAPVVTVSVDGPQTCRFSGSVPQLEALDGDTSGDSGLGTSPPRANGGSGAGEMAGGVSTLLPPQRFSNHQRSSSCSTRFALEFPPDGEDCRGIGGALESAALPPLVLLSLPRPPSQDTVASEGPQDGEALRQQTEEAIHAVLNLGMLQGRDARLNLTEHIVHKLTTSLSNRIHSACTIGEPSAASMAESLERTLKCLEVGVQDETIAKTLKEKVWETSYELVQNLSRDLSQNPAALREIALTFDRLCHDEPWVNWNEEFLGFLYGLELRSMTTKQLILAFELERYLQQKDLSKSPLGALAVQGYRDSNSLHIIIRNGRELGTPKNEPNPYVSVQLRTPSGIQKVKTAVHKKTRYPLFDHAFNFDFSQMPTPVSMEECMLLFTVRDKGVAMNSFLGEAYLPVNELPVGCEADLAEFPQLSLPLSKPDLYNGDLGKDILVVLEQRVGFCREASDYFRKLKDRSVKPLLPPPKSGLLGSPRIGQRLKLGIPESLGQSILSLTNKGRKSSLGFIFNRMVPFQQKPMANKQLTAMNSTGANDSPKPSPKQKKTSNPT